MDLVDYVASAVGDLCAHAAEDPDGGCGEEPAPTYSPTKPPSTPPTKPPTKLPGKPPHGPGGKPEPPDTGADPALWGAGAVSAALIVGGTVVQLRGARLVRNRRH